MNTVVGLVVAQDVVETGLLDAMLAGLVGLRDDVVRAAQNGNLLVWIGGAVVVYLIVSRFRRQRP